MEKVRVIMTGKRLSVLFVVIIAVLFFGGLPNDAAGSDWVYYGSGSSGDQYFYDRTSIRQVPEGVIRVWTKVVYSDEGRQRKINDYKKDGYAITGFELLSETQNLWFINCIEEKSTVTEGRHHASNGRVVDMYKADKRIWGPAAPGSPVESLIKMVCEETRPRKK
jgi:hypothetical protein